MKGGRVDGMLKKGTIEEGTERGRAGATETYGEVASEGGRSEEGREQGANEVGKFQGRYSEQDTSQYTVYNAQHTAALALETLVLQKKNSGRVYKLCIVMRRYVLFDKWMTCFYVMAIMDWVHTIFGPNRLQFQTYLGVAADTHGKVRASTVFVSYSLHVSIVGFFTLRQKLISSGSEFA